MPKRPSKSKRTDKWNLELKPMTEAEARASERVAARLLGRYFKGKMTAPKEDAAGESPTDQSAVPAPEIHKNAKREKNYEPQTRVVSETSLVSDYPYAQSETSLVDQTSLVSQTTLNHSVHVAREDFLAGVTHVDGYLQVPHTINDQILPRLSAYSQIVYYRLYRLSHGFGSDCCSLSLPTLAQKTGLSESSVQRALRDLQQKGLVEKLGHTLGRDKAQGSTFRLVTLTSLVPQTSLVEETRVVPQTTNKKNKRNKIKAASVADAPSPSASVADAPSPVDIYEIRKIAVRLFELHHTEPNYSHDRLIADVRTALEGQGSEVDQKLLEEAVRAVR